MEEKRDKRLSMKKGEIASMPPSGRLSKEECRRSPNNQSSEGEGSGSACSRVNQGQDRKGKSHRVRFSLAPVDAELGIFKI